ncbi:MAG: hypothetical protein ABI192_11210 [Bradyrhizobium sp.]
MANALKGSFGLYREADGDLGRTVENLWHVIAQQAAELAGGSRAACQFDSPITGAAIRANDIGFFHVANTRSCRCPSCMVDGCDNPATRSRLCARVDGNMAMPPGLPLKAIIANGDIAARALLTALPAAQT